MDIAFTPLQPWQEAAINNPYTHFVFYAGVASGKTFAGSHFIIKHVMEHPEKTGCLGAKDYGQLSQVALRELFYWLDVYGFEYTIDPLTTASWNYKRAFKSMGNILLIRNPWTGTVSTIFTRIMSNPNVLRGIEFSYCWVDDI